MIGASLEPSEAEATYVGTAGKAYQDAISDHEHTIRRRREINKIAPVFRLIPEILGEILTYISHAETYGLYECEWLTATHICHEWREIALRSPRVWSNLFLMSNTDCLKELIARSKNAPLHITTGHYASRVNLDLALDQLHRIHTLQLFLDVKRPEMSVSPPFNAPELRHLELVDLYPASPQTITLPFEYDCDLPKLKRLDTRSYALCLSWTSTIFKSTITHLFLQHTLPSTSTLDETLEALAGMPNLKSLQLRDVLPSLFHGSARNVHLPHLELLDLIETCKSCSPLLQHVTYPPTAKLRIELSSPLSRSDVTELSSQIATKLSDPHSSGASVRSLLITNADFDIVAAWREHLTATEIIPDRPENADVELELDLQNSRHYEAILKQILSPLPLSNVHTIGLVSGATFSSCWKTFSRSMPSVQELGVSSTNSEESQMVLRLLVVRSPKPDSPAPPPLFPRLNVLLLSGMWFCEDAYDEDPAVLRLLRKMLRSRQLSKRTSRIEELVLKNTINLDETDVEDIHKLVGKVTWDPDDVRWVGFTDSEDDDDSDEESGSGEEDEDGTGDDESSDD